MTRFNLETEMQDILNDLTPAEREALAAATSKDWMQAIAETAADPGFWSEMGAAFLNGMLRGLEGRR